MKLKKIMLAACLLLAILTIGAVSASDGADNMSVGAQDSIELGASDTDIIAEDSSDVDDELESDEYPEVGITTRVNYEYSDVSIVEYNFPENATGNISVFIDESDEPSYHSEVITGRDVEIFADDLNDFEFKPGVFIIDVIYSGNDNYGEMNWSSVLTITEEEDQIGDGPDVEITTLVYYEDTDEAIVRYYFPENATGSISILIDDEDAYSSNITTGSWVSIYADDLKGFEFVPGAYDIVVTYPGDDNYGIYEWDATLQITDEKDDPGEDYDPDFNITFDEYYNYNQDVIKGRGTYDAYFEFPMIAEGTVTVYVDNNYYDVKEIDFGDVYVEVETGNLTLGKHDVRFEYSGDEHFKASSLSGSFNVTYIRYEVPSILNQDAGGVSANTAFVAMPFDATGDVKLLVDDIEKTTESVDEGSAMFWLPDYVTYGNHTVALVYQNGNYQSTSKKFDVENLIKDSKVEPALNVSVSDIKVGQIAIVTISIDEAVSGNVLVTVGNSTFTVNIVNGKGSQNVSGLAAGTYDVKVTFEGNDNFTSAVASAAFKVDLLNISDADIALSKSVFTYNAKVQKPAVTLTDGIVLKEGVDYTLQWSTGSKNAGTYSITVTGTGIYTGVASVKYAINKAANPLAVKVKTVKVKFSALKKKAQTLAVSKVITFSKKGQGTLTYVKSSGNKKITVNKKTGKVTVAKGLKKGTYSVKVKIKAAGNANYKASAYKTVTFKIKVN